MLRTDYCSYGSSTAMYRGIKVLSTCPLYKNSVSLSVNTHFSLQKKKQFAERKLGQQWGKQALIL
jgi:hypothetical protein